VPDAIVGLEAAIELEPRHFRANLLLGRLLSLTGRAGSAVPHLRTAVDVQPASAEAHEFLADAYEKTGNASGAAEERQRAQQLGVKKAR
jgi:predicted Zn-dependent protease